LINWLVYESDRLSRPVLYLLYKLKNRIVLPT